SNAGGNAGSSAGGNAGSNAGGNAGSNAGGNGGGTGGGGTGGSAGSGGTGGTGGAGAAGSGGTGALPPDAGTPPPLTGAAFVFAAGAEFGGAQITSFAFDLKTGALSRKGTSAAGPSPDYVAVHPSGKFLFVNNENESGR